MEEGLLLSVCWKPVVHLDRELKEDVPWGEDQAPLYSGCSTNLMTAMITELHSRWLLLLALIDFGV